MTRLGHQRGLPVPLFDQYDAGTKLGGSMRRRTSIGIALLALSHLAFANVSSALAQAGSTGGTVGKQDKSISGGEEAERPRAASHPKRSAAKAQETSSGHSCGRIVGRWTWHGVDMVFNPNGTVQQPISGNKGSWTCAGAVVKSVWTNGDRDQLVVSNDGNTASVTTTWAGGHNFTLTRRRADTAQ
jgi:hypothetical protein